MHSSRPPFSIYGWILRLNWPEAEHGPFPVVFDVAISDQQEAVRAVRLAAGAPETAEVAVIGKLTLRLRKALRLRDGEVHLDRSR